MNECNTVAGQQRGEEGVLEEKREKGEREEDGWQTMKN